MFRSLKLGRLFGIPLYIHWTFWILPLLVILAHGGSAPLFFLAVLFALFGCVVLHELGHAVAARAFGIRTRDITLYPIGGVARLERMSEKPGEELAIAVAGPAVNVVLAGAFIFRVLWKRGSVSFNAALLATGAYLFNPALIFDSAYWGQTAAIHVLFMLLSVIAADRRRYDWAGAALAAAILTKPQAIAIAPLILLLAVREGGGLRLVGGAAVATVLITAPFILAGNGGSVVQEYAQTTQYHPFVAPNAHNLWWFATGGRGWQSDTNLIGLVSFRRAGLLTFTAATMLSLTLVWRDRRSLFLVAAYQALAFFMLNTQIHENHLLAMFAPLVIAAVLDRQLWWFYGAFVLTSVANMTLHDPKLFAWLGYPSNEIYGGPALAVPRWLNAAVQTMLFMAFTVRLVIPIATELRLTRTRIQA